MNAPPPSDSTAGRLLDQLGDERALRAAKISLALGDEDFADGHAFLLLDQRVDLDDLTAQARRQQRRDAGFSRTHHADQGYVLGHGMIMQAGEAILTVSCLLLRPFLSDISHRPRVGLYAEHLWPSFPDHDVGRVARRGVGVVVDGCPARLPLAAADIQVDLDRRRARARARSSRRARKATHARSFPASPTARRSARHLDHGP